MRFDTLRSDEARDVLARRPVVLLPIGAVENHGDHLPLSTDNLLAEALADRVAEWVDDSVVLPVLPYGQVWSTSDYPGTISLGTETLVAVLVDIGASLAAQGAGLLAIVNGHMGNLDAMKAAARRLLDEHGLKTLTLTYPGANAVAAEVLEAPRVHATYFHACELETSYMLHLAPEHVDLARAKANYPDLPADFDVTPTRWTEVSPESPVFGDPTLASAEKGRAVIDATVRQMVDLIAVARGRDA